MDSFNYNYNEQANKLQEQQQQQQKTLIDQDYVLEDITENYNLESREREKQSLVNVLENTNVYANKKFTYSTNRTEQNNSEYGKINYQKNPTMYFDRMADDNTGPTKFYTILPNKEAAEKLAALAAAGNINSRLIGQLRKQQQKDIQKDQTSHNHKNVNDDGTNEQQIDLDQQGSHYKNYNHKKNYNIKDNEKLPLQITVLDDYIMSDDDQENNTRENLHVEYEYEIEDDEIQDP